MKSIRETVFWGEKKYRAGWLRQSRVTNEKNKTAQEAKSQKFKKKGEF